MAILDSQYVDLLVKKLDGVAKTDTATNKSPSNESILSPQLNRGDTCWTEAVSIPTLAAATPNLIEENINSNAIECTADTTCVPIGGIYPTWLTGITDWVPPDFGSTYTVQAYVGPPGAGNIVATGTFISNAGQAGVGEWFFDYQAGLLNFIGETIPASLTVGNVVYITGFNYIGLTGVTNLPGNTTIGNINIVDTTLTSTDINGNLITFEGSSGIVIPSGNSTQRPGNAVLGTTRFNTTIDAIEVYDGAQWATGGNVIVPGTIVDQQILPDGTSNTYTLVQSTTTDAVLVSINGINQLPSVAYTVANTSITFTQTPLTQDLIDIRFISYVTTISALTNSSGNASITVTPTGNILFTTAGNLLSTMSSNYMTVAGGISASGNITTSGYFVGNLSGNISGNILAPGANTQVIYNNNGNLQASSGFTFNQSSNILSVSGNVIGGNILSNGFISAVGLVIGGNISGTNITGNLISGNQANITNVGTLASLTVNGNLNGSNILATFISVNTINAANIGNTGTEYIGTNLSVTGNVIANNLSGTLTTTAQTNITSVGTLTSLSVTGDVSLTGNIVVPSTLSVTGNISASGNINAPYFIGNGSQLTGLTATYGNSNVVNLLNTGLGGNIIPSANGVYTLGNATNQWASVYVGANTLYINNVAISINSANILTVAGDNVVAQNANGNITAGNVSTTGNVTGNYIIGDGSQLINLPVGNYSNSNVSSFLSNFGSNVISTSGNISGNYFIGNGSTLTSVAGANVTGTVANATFATTAGSTGSATSATTAGTVTSNAQANITSVGTLTSLSVTGNVTGGNILTAGFVSATGNATAGNIRTAGIVSATGNITGGNLSVSTGTVTLGNIVNANGNGVGNIGSSGLYFNTIFAQATTALYADLAENYLADAEYAPGTVLSFGGSAELTLSTQDQDPLIAGVVSTNPAYNMNSGLTGEFVTTLALIGRVPCLVQGPVSVGSMMVSAGNGRARAEKNPAMGTVIGKSISSFDGDIGTVEIVVGRL